MNNEAIKKIADTYGYDVQSRQLIEEMAELMVAVNKYHRALELYDIEYESAFVDIRKNDIAEEIADVTIMLEQIKYLLSLNIDDIDLFIEHKLNRQLERIEKNE
jgi:NTP pyrophosphatase (non-canonical NTP hydrolase)